MNTGPWWWTVVLQPVSLLLINNAWEDGWIRGSGRKREVTWCREKAGWEMEEKGEERKKQDGRWTRVRPRPHAARLKEVSPCVGQREPLDCQVSLVECSASLTMTYRMSPPHTLTHTRLADKVLIHPNWLPPPLLAAVLSLAPGGSLDEHYRCISD